jgi:hypothetical protein
MKSFEQLTDTEKVAAIQRATNKLLDAICEGSVRFNDALNGDNLQARIDSAIAAANAMQTPWFASEYVMDACRDDIESMARCDAEDALYAEPGESVVHGIAA